MAKRLVKWSLDGTILKASQALEDPKAVAEIMAEFNLTKLYPTFAEMNDIQKQIVVYGVKQKLMDVGAGDIADVNGKVTAAKKKWAELLDGKWAGERVNATGAAENREIANKAKEILAGPVSMQSLMMKKFLKPNEFTAEDAAKLDEFIAEVAKQNAKGKAKNG